MKKKFNIKTIIFLVIILTLTSYYFINLTIGNNKFNNFKSFLSKEQIKLIKKYIFPYRLIFQQEQNIIQLEQAIFQQEEKISQQEETISDQKLIINQQGQDIIHQEHNLIALLGIKTSRSTLKLLNNKILVKYKLNSGFVHGIHETTPGSGYLDFYKDNILVISSRGLLVFKKSLSDLNEKFKFIKNNIHDFISFEQFNKERWFSIKDIHISKNQVFISYTEEIEENCWNTSVIFGDINFENIIFNKLFSSQDCIHSIHNIDNSFNAHQSGGRIVSIDDKNILLSVGDYRERFLAQTRSSVNGKLIKINIKSGQYKIFSMGHRNPQGLYFDKENNFILETEHGPQGGDEINLIEVYKNNSNMIPNYGWPISSAGEHYGGKIEHNKKIYEKYPLHKSHSQHGFIEPLKSFVPSIAISEILKIGRNNYVVGSMKDKSLYFFELNNQKKIINLEQIEVFERIRDLKFKDNKLFLFMENTPSIGIIDLNS